MREVSHNLHLLMRVNREALASCDQLLRCPRRKRPARFDKDVLAFRGYLASCNDVQPVRQLDTRVAMHCAHCIRGHCGEVNSRDLQVTSVHRNRLLSIQPETLCRRQNVGCICARGDLSFNHHLPGHIIRAERQRSDPPLREGVIANRRRPQTHSSHVHRREEDVQLVERVFDSSRKEAAPHQNPRAIVGIAQVDVYPNRAHNLEVGAEASKNPERHCRRNRRRADVGESRFEAIELRRGDPLERVRVPVRDFPHPDTSTDRPQLSAGQAASLQRVARQGRIPVSARDQIAHQSADVAGDVNLSTIVRHDLRAAHTCFRLALDANVHALNAAQGCVLHGSSGVARADEVSAPKSLEGHTGCKRIQVIA